MKNIIGTVTSDKMNKAAVIVVERSYRHPLYGKIMKLKKNLHVVNEIGAKVGQKVKIVETKPISKTISFKITEIIYSSSSSLQLSSEIMNSKTSVRQLADSSYLNIGIKKNEEEPPSPAVGGIRRAKVK